MRIRRKRKYGFLSLALSMVLLGLLSCEDPYLPKATTKYENLLVVDGMITNAPGPYTIKLSSTVRVDRVEYIPVSGYEVIITDDLGNAEILSETETGVYQSDTNGIQGIPGRTYQLTLHSPDGKTYQSSPEKLNPPVGIDSVYARLEYHVQPYSFSEVPGYRFYVDSKPSNSDSTHFYWLLTSTYKYKSDLIIRWIFDGTLRPFTNSDSLRTCWKTQKVPEIFIYNTKGLSGSFVDELPLHFVSTGVRDISIRYSLLVEQLAITSKAYTYWQSVKEQNAASGELYTKQPYQIRGNLFSPDDPDELVLGYFMAAGNDSRRIYVNRPPPTIEMNYTICTLSEAEYWNFGIITMTPKQFWPIYATFDNSGRNALPDNQDCMNCILKGGTIIKPEFWVDE